MGGWQTRSRGRKGEGGNGVNIRESSARGGSENKLVPGVGSLPPPPPPNKLDPGVESKTRLWRARRVQYPAFTWGTWMCVVPSAPIPPLARKINSLRGYVGRRGKEGMFTSTPNPPAEPYKKQPPSPLKPLALQGSSLQHLLLSSLVSSPPSPPGEIFCLPCE